MLYGSHLEIGGVIHTFFHACSCPLSNRGYNVSVLYYYSQSLYS